MHDDQTRTRQVDTGQGERDAALPDALAGTADGMHGRVDGDGPTDEVPDAAADAPAHPEQNDAFEALVGYLKQSRGFDFTGYKRASLMRRMDKRMHEVGVQEYAAYVDYLEVHPDEFAALFNTVLINVTAFFRDAEAWAYLRATVIPGILARKAPDAPIRVWSAGCASGEEAYSLAIALTEALGIDEFRSRVKIYATDMDDDALARARSAVYAPADLADLPAELLERYFERGEARYTFRADLRRSVIFGRHDLIQDAPISRMDLLACRNVLMYFNTETQARILARFHFALNDAGVLFLGRAETLLTRTSLFAPVDLRRRVFAKVPRGAGSRRPLPALTGSDDTAGHGMLGLALLRDAAFDQSPTAQLVFNPEGLLALANERARTLFGLTPGDVGRPLQDLELSYRPVELRSRIDRAYIERHAVLIDGVEWPTTPGGEIRTFCVEIALVGGGANGPAGVTVTFNDVSAATRLRSELEQSHQELEAAYEELQSTNEELETTNEELQSTVEELETTNEELQSANEELETMNEELQSTNEELQTINDEVRRRSDELNHVNAFLEAILAGMRGAVVVLDADLGVLVWNRGAEDLWGVRADEVAGKHFFNLDVGLPVGELRHALRQAIAGESLAEPVTLRATNRRGKPFDCRVTVTSFHASDHTRGAILMLE